MGCGNPVAQKCIDILLLSMAIFAAMRNARRSKGRPFTPTHPIRWRTSSKRTPPCWAPIGLKLVVWKPTVPNEANSEETLSMLERMLNDRELPSTVGKKYGEGLRLVVDVNDLPASFVTGGQLVSWLERLRQTRAWGGIQMVYIVLNSTMTQVLSQQTRAIDCNQAQRIAE